MRMSINASPRPPKRLQLHNGQTLPPHKGRESGLRGNVFETSQRAGDKAHNMVVDNILTLTSMRCVQERLDIPLCGWTTASVLLMHMTPCDVWTFCMAQQQLVIALLEHQCTLSKYQVMM